MNIPSHITRQFDSALSLIRMCGHDPEANDLEVAIEHLGLWLKGELEERDKTISLLNEENKKLKTELFNQLGVPVFDPKNSNPNYFMGVDLANMPDSSAEINITPKPKE
jgi:hypothetical protein